MKITTAQWAVANNPLIANSRKIATKLETLASTYRQDAAHERKEMLRMSREIYEESRNFIAQCRRVADNCTDHILRNQLIKALETIQTMTTQMKIVTAVKGAEPRDSESEKQLITITRNLVNAYKQAIRAAESASIRALKSATTVALAAVKFRKVLYARTHDGMPSPKLAAARASRIVSPQ